MPPSHLRLISPCPRAWSVPFNTAAPQASVQYTPTSSVLTHTVVKPCACTITLQPTCASPASACRALVHHIHAEPAPSSLPRCVPYAMPKLACTPSSILATSMHRYHPSHRPPSRPSLHLQCTSAPDRTIMDRAIVGGHPHAFWPAIPLSRSHALIPHLGRTSPWSLSTRAVGPHPCALSCHTSHRRHLRHIIWSRPPCP